MPKNVKVNKEAAAELKELRQIKKDYERLNCLVIIRKLNGTQL